MDEAGSREGGEAFEVRWEVGLTTVAGSLDYVLLLLTDMIYERRGNLPWDGIHESLSCRLADGPA